MNPHRKQQLTFTLVLVLLGLSVLAALRIGKTTTPPIQTVPYSQFITALREGRFKAVEIEHDQLLGTGDNTALRTVRPPALDDPDLARLLREHAVQVVGRAERPSLWTEMLLGWLLPIVLIGALWWGGMRRIGARSGPLQVGEGKVHDALANAPKVSFQDVAGVDEARAELEEIVDFLRNPSRYEKLGGRFPKGVLLVGPPGTGKTLLARAVAGEAAVPFFSLSGSEFVEMFVGVGAARVRALFEQAKRRAPCIVFIDELDAIGKSRGNAAAWVSHDEREQTLNQLLVEMDGFDTSSGVILMAATNRPEVLDRALLRAGRFDRQILVDRPDIAGREAILGVHARKLKLDPDVDLRAVAARTAGMVGADLANVINEAALAAARRLAPAVSARDLDEALDRIQLGLAKRGQILSPEEKRRVAYHEAGHTLVALSMEHGDPVHRVTIIPRAIGFVGSALGATLQLPTEDRHLHTRSQLDDRLAVLLGGRAAEEVALGEVSSGAQNDLERATEMAQLMVCQLGMSEALGPATYARQGMRFLDGEALGRAISESTQQRIDAEVAALVERARSRAREVLGRRRDALDRLAAALLERETLERPEIEALLRGPETEEAIAASQAG